VEKEGLTMRGIRRFATAHPLPVVIVASVVWMMTGGIAAYLAAGVLRLPLTHVLPQSLGTLVATACLLLVMWRWEWLRAAGVTALGRRDSLESHARPLSAGHDRDPADRRRARRHPGRGLADGERQVL
jgi:protein-S-isoprenylcysteine O-methyltransferase Ste14